MNNKYRIKYNYDSGDSFNSYPNNEGYVEISWNSLEKAKENLKRIEEHYSQYKELNKWNGESIEETLDKNQNKDWFVKVMKDCVYYISDTTKKRTYNCIDEKSVEKWKEKGYEVGTFIDKTSAENQIILYTDDNKPFQFWCPWCGYFEHLNYCEIEVNLEEESNLKFYA